MIPRVRPELSFTQLARAAAALHRGEALAGFGRQLGERAGLCGDVVLTPSGRAALYLLFKASPLPTVYLPAYSCWAVLEAAQLAGKTVRYLDIDYPGVHVAPDQYRERCREPGIVVATHQFGYPENVSRVREILAGRGHLIIEDCAGALLSRLAGEPVGHAGDAAIYSFEAGKLLTLGGGALTVRDAALGKAVAGIVSAEVEPAGGLPELMRLAFRRLSTVEPLYGALLRVWLAVAPPTQGQLDGAEIPTALYRRGLSGRQACLGQELLQGLIERGARRRRVLRIYHEALASVPDITRVSLMEGADPCPIRFPFLVPAELKPVLYRRMVRAGVDLGFTFSYALDPSSPGAVRFASQVLNLPIHSGVDETRARQVVAHLQDCMAKG